jgi:hypothetical protein
VARVSRGRCTVSRPMGGAGHAKDDARRSVGTTARLIVTVASFMARRADPRCRSRRMRTRPRRGKSCEPRCSAGTVPEPSQPRQPGSREQEGRGCGLWGVGQALEPAMERLVHPAVIDARAKPDNWTARDTRVRACFWAVISALSSPAIASATLAVVPWWTDLHTIGSSGSCAIVGPACFCRQHPAQTLPSAKLRRATPADPLLTPPAAIAPPGRARLVSSRCASTRSDSDRAPKGRPRCCLKRARGQNLPDLRRQK